MQSLTIPEWCARHQISRALFYNLMKAGKAPRIMKVGSAVRIRDEADRDWCRAREAETNASLIREASAA
jgi:predicted DNA-binding transcriptional regulator AlpA